MKKQAILLLMVLALIPFVSGNIFEQGVKLYLDFRENATVSDYFDKSGNANNASMDTDCLTTGDSILDFASTPDGGTFDECLPEGDAHIGLTASQRAVSFWSKITGNTSEVLFQLNGDFSSDFCTSNDCWIVFNNPAVGNFGGLMIETDINTFCRLPFSMPVIRNQYNHYVITSGSGGGTNLYVNGTLHVLNSSAECGSYASTSDPYILFGEPGVIHPGNRFFTVDELGVWDYAIGTSLISELYNNHQGLNPFAAIANVTLNNNNLSQGYTTNATIFNSTLLPLSFSNATNATLNIWRSGLLFRTVSNVTINTNVSVALSETLDVAGGNFSWNVLGCSENVVLTGCNSSQQNGTFFIDAFEHNISFTPSVVENSNTTINLNLSYDDDRFGIDVDLIYNGSRYDSTPSGSSGFRVFTASPSTPSVSGSQNVSFYWEINLSGDIYYNSTSNMQTVMEFGIDDCSAFGDLILNFTLKDEDELTTLNATEQNTSVEIDLTLKDNDGELLGNFSQTYSEINPSQVCLQNGTLTDTSFILDAQVRYTASDYVVEFFNIQNSTLNNQTYPQDIDLYPLLSGNSQEFLIIFRDTDFLPVSDALITVTRKYVGEGIFRTVEAPETNSDGQAIVHLVLGDVIYTLQVSKNGRLLGTFENIVAFCENIAIGDCTINLFASSTGTEPLDFETINNVTYAFNFNRPTRTASVIFNTLDGSSATFNLTGTLFDNRGNTTVCTDTLTTSAGTIECVVPVSVGNSTVKLDFYKGNTFIATAFFNLQDPDDTGFGGTGIIMLMILYITIPLMMITSGVGIVIGAIIGLIIAGLLLLYDGGTVLGIGATLIWFIIAGGILIWKINALRNR